MVKEGTLKTTKPCLRRACKAAKSINIMGNQHKQSLLSDIFSNAKMGSKQRATLGMPKSLEKPSEICLLFYYFHSRPSHHVTASRCPIHYLPHDLVGSLRNTSPKGSPGTQVLWLPGLTSRAVLIREQLTSKNGKRTVM